MDNQPPQSYLHRATDVATPDCGLVPGLGADGVGARLPPQTADLPPEVADKKIDRSSTSTGGRSQPGPGTGALPPAATDPGLGLKHSSVYVWRNHRTRIRHFETGTMRYLLFNVKTAFRYIRNNCDQRRESKDVLATPPLLINTYSD